MSEFFNEAKEQSVVKATIVAKYFHAWARVLAGWADKLAYIDLYAGPGRYDDGTVSTPLKVLETAIADPKLAGRLVVVLNDADAANVAKLREEIAKLPGVGTLKYPPTVDNHEVDGQTAAQLQSMTLVPSFSFIDPWGYKGLSMGLINGVLKDWGSDCVFFFNYNRINMGLPNDLVDRHMDGLFGAERAERLREAIKGRSKEVREALIVEGICDALREMGGRYVLPFRFHHPEHGRVSHHLIFVSKHRLGYTIMKDIMAAESSSTDQGVPSFEYNPRVLSQGLLFSLSRPVDGLRDELPVTFAGRSLTRDQLFEAHHIDTPFVKANYNDALHQLEEAGRVSVQRPPKSKPKRNGKFTYGEKTIITFPAVR